jgi:hypothetical protein
LVASFDNLISVSTEASSSSNEKDDEVLGLISLMEIDSWGRSVDALGFGISVVNDFLERLLLCDYGSK